MYHSNNPYRPIETQIIDVIVETSNICTLKMVLKEPIEFKAGQFIELTVPGVGEAPFTPSSNPRTNDNMEVSVMNVGKVTAKIHQLSKGDIIGIRGPFGTGYPLDDFLDQEILVVGGGCGFAPLRSLLYEFFNMSGQFKKIFFKGGCKSPEDFLYKSQTEEWSKRDDIDIELTVDSTNGSEWKGHVGVVTTILDNIDMDCSCGVCVICGPPIMMKFATQKALDLGFKPDKIYLSMEKNMSCGLGKCGHCRIGNYYACKDGPVFTYDEIRDSPVIWD